jgi:hypothetical protein
VVAIGQSSATLAGSLAAGGTLALAVALAAGGFLAPRPEAAR